MTYQDLPFAGPGTYTGKIVKIEKSDKNIKIFWILRHEPSQQRLRWGEDLPPALWWKLDYLGVNPENPVKPEKKFKFILYLKAGKLLTRYE